MLLYSSAPDVAGSSKPDF